MTKTNHAANRANNRRVIEGIVKSDRMDKTIVVEASYKLRHPLYSKVVARHTKVKAHDEKNLAKTGDKVSVRESKPFSKEKKWVLATILEKAENLKGTKEANKS